MAAKLRKLRRRYGIAAPRVAVRTHVPWYWRWLRVVALGAFCAMVAIGAVWLHGLGRRAPDPSREQLLQQLAQARSALQGKDGELQRLRAAVDAASSRIVIEHTTERKLAQQVRSLEQENGRVSEELAIFEKMLSTDWRAAPALAIYHFRVESDMLPGEYRYRMLLLASGGHRDKDFEGRLELVVSLADGGKRAVMVFPEKKQSSASAFQLSFKRFERVEGTFRIDPAAKVDNVQVRVYKKGATQPLATQRVNLG